MKAVTIPKAGKPEVLEIRNYPDPRPRSREVSIKVAAAGVNFADIQARMGLYPDAPGPPLVVGYEVAGEILEVGGIDRTQMQEAESNDTADGKSAAGDVTGKSAARDVSGKTAGSGESAPNDASAKASNRFSPGDRVLALTRFNGYSETVVVPQDQVFPVPDNLSLAEAAAIPVNYLTAWQLTEMGGLKNGDTLLIHNAGGGVGLAALDLARRRGARTIGTASAGKHERLIERGLDIAIDYRTENWVERVLEHTNGKGADLIFDPIGGSNWKKSIRALRPTGRLGMYGVSEVTRSFFPGSLKFLSVLGRMPFYTPVQLMNQNKGVYGVNIGRLWNEKQKVMQWALAILEGAKEGWIRPHVDAVFTFEQAAEAHRYIEERRNFGKVLLTPGKLSDSG